LSTSWSSGTTVSCMANAFADIFGGVEVRVGGVAGTGRPVFSFDGAVVSSVLLNTPHSGYAWLPVNGLNFGVGEQTATTGLELGGLRELGACSTSSWSSSTSLICASTGVADLFGLCN
jgi:hypothetical protein